MLLSYVSRFLGKLTPNLSEDIMALSQRGDFDRKFRSFWRHFYLVFKAFVFATGAVLFWQWLNSAGIHFSRRDEVSLSSFILPGAVTAFFLTAGWFLTDARIKFKIMIQSVLDNDERMFMKYRDERFPTALNLLLIAISIIVLGLTMMIDFQEFSVGAVSVFSVSYFIVHVWIVLIQTDNPAECFWVIERVPPHWRTQSVDKYFNLIDQRSEEGKILQSQPLTQPASAE